MKNRNWKRKILSFVGMLLLLTFGIASSGSEALAASAVVSLLAGEEEVKKGDIFAVIVTVESADEIGNVEMFVNFDSSCVSFVDNGKYTIGGDGLVLVSDWDDSKASTRKKYALEFKAKKPGLCKFSIGDQPGIFLAESSEQMSVSSISMSVTVTKKNAKDTEEETEGKQPEVGVTEQPVTDTAEESLGNTDAESLEGNTGEAELETENSNLEESGETEFGIEDIPESGGEPEFGIHAAKSDNKIVITQYEKLTVKKVKDDTLIPSGYRKTNIRMGGESVIAYMSEEDMDSQIYLIYGTDGNGRCGFYEYNCTEGTLKPYVANYGGDMAAQATEAVTANFQMMTAIFILMFLCAILSVALVLTIRKQKRKPVFDRIEEPDYLKDIFQDSSDL